MRFKKLRQRLLKIEFELNNTKKELERFEKRPNEANKQKLINQEKLVATQVKYLTQDTRYLYIGEKAIYERKEFKW
jgi:septal ring factor EnvC (AmiA/AmiB activator)